MMPKTQPATEPLVGSDRAEIAAFVADQGLPRFRAAQVTEWVYRHAAESWETMANLPRALRQSLGELRPVAATTLRREQVSADGCRKLLLALHDGETVETVVLPYDDRTAVCVSTQAGCPIRCPFCATGLSGYARDLTAGEIVDQVLAAKRVLRGAAAGMVGVTHVTFMGMGEPLLNYDAVLKAVRLLNEEVGLGMRRLTISTVGVVPAMDRLAAEKLQLTLAVSLHAPEQALRQQLVPLARRYPLTDLLPACQRYVDLTGRRLTFEYVLLGQVNDSVEQARALARLVRPLPAAVNLIPYNAVADAVSFRRPSTHRIQAFRTVLEEAGVSVTQRVERGADLAGACGQLRRQERSRSASHATR